MKTRKNYAFTIFELVVVLAIITTLIAMLFPVFQKAREAGRKANCVSNLKQIGVALSLYIDDYRHLLPKIGASSIEWAETLNTLYIDDQQLFYCPSLGNDTFDFTSMEGDVGISYGFSWFIPESMTAHQRYDSIARKTTKPLVADVQMWWSQPTPKFKNRLTVGISPAVNMNIGRHHNNGANILMCDFHVEWRAPPYPDNSDTSEFTSGG